MLYVSHVCVKLNLMDCAALCKLSSKCKKRYWQICVKWYNNWVLIFIRVFFVLFCSCVIGSLLIAAGCIFVLELVPVGFLSFVGVFAASYVALVLLYLLGCGLLCLFVDKNKPIEKQYPLCRGAIGALADFLMLHLGVRFSAEGLEKLPRDRRFLLVCNHRGAFDPICMMGRLKKYEISCVSKPSNMKIPVLSRLAYGMGYLPIDRENDRKALKTILQAADYLKRDVCSMCIYPEGTRSRSGKLLPFHAGSFKIAQRGNAPLAIACISGSESVFKNFPFRPTHVKLKILEILPAEKVKALSTQELSDYSRNLIEENL